MCDKSKKFVMGRDPEHQTMVFLDTQCGCYDCPQCVDGIKRLHQARIIHATKEHPQTSQLKWSFVTLTCPSHVRDRDQSLALMKQALPKWRKRMKRRYGDYPYVLAYERHADGAVHVHMLIGACVSKKHVRRNAVAVGLGYITDCQRLHSPAAAGKYLAKYLSKSLTGADMWPKRMKRVCYSYNFPKLPERESTIRVWQAIDKTDLHNWVVYGPLDGEGIYVDKYLTARLAKTHPEICVKSGSVSTGY